MKIGRGQTILLAVLLALAPFMMAVDCGPMNHGSVRSAFGSWRPPVPPIWGPDGRWFLINKGAQVQLVATDGSSIEPFPQDREKSLEARSYGCSGGGICPPLEKLEHASDLSVGNVIVMNKLKNTGLDDPDFDIQTMRIDGAERRTLTSGWYPSWSPDGKRIAFFNNDGLHTVGTDGGDLTEVALDSAYMSRSDLHCVRCKHGSPPAWSPDGSKIAFLAKDVKLWQEYDAPRDLYVVRADGSELSRISGSVVAEPAWSPKGDSLTFMQNENGVATIFTIRADGSGIRALASFPSRQYQFASRYESPRGRMEWSADGSEIRVQKSPFVTVGSDGANLRIMGTPWDGQSDRTAYGSWSPDGSSIAVYVLQIDRFRPISMPVLFVMTSNGMEKRVLINEGYYAGVPGPVLPTKGEVMNAIDALQWMNLDEYSALLAQEKSAEATEVSQ